MEGGSARPRCSRSIVLSAALPNVSVVLVSISRDWYRTILPTSFTLSHFEAALGHGMVVPSIGNSLRYVTLSTALDLVLGVAIAYVVVAARLSRGPPARRCRDAALGGAWAGHGLRLPGDIARGTPPRVPQSGARSHRAPGRCLLDTAAPVRGSRDRSRAPADQRGRSKRPPTTSAPTRCAPFGGSRCRCSAPTCWRAESSPSPCRCSRYPTRSSSLRDRAPSPSPRRSTSSSSSSARGVGSRPLSASGRWHFSAWPSRLPDRCSAAGSAASSASKSRR